MEYLQCAMATYAKKVLKFALLFLGVFLLSRSAHAATYYFSSSVGNDEYTSIQARNPLTPWKTLNKLNSFFKNLGAGDSILFKRGEIFYGSITADRAGAVFSPIYFGAYGAGNKPEISGLSALTNWKMVKPGVYATACTAGGATLIINNKPQALGRYPNKGYLTYQSHNANSSVTGAPLAEDWTGAEVVIRKNRWVIDKAAITGQSAGTISYNGSSQAAPTNGYGYFIQNSLKTLDQFGEWYFDPAQKLMYVYFGNRNPASYHVKTNAVENLVDIKRLGYITFENLTFTGAGNNAFNIIQSRKITVKNCNINLAGADAVFGNYSPFVTVDNCNVNHALSGGVNLDGGCVNSVVANNYIKNVGLLAGMGKSGTGTYEGITSFGGNTRIERNRIDSVGYNGIYFGGSDSYAKNNYITYFCITKDDGAGIYIGDWSKTMNKKVVGNIVLHGIGNGAGTTYPASLQAEGIYIDDNTESVIIADNTVSLCANNGIKIHNAKDIAVYNNTVVNNGVQLRLEQDHYVATSSVIRNNQIRNNVFISTNARQAAAKFSSHQDDIHSFGQLESNFYSQPKTGGEAIVTTVVRNGKDVKQHYSLSNWQSVYGKDTLSTEVHTADNLLFEYNATSAAKTISLNKPYIDIHNNVRTGKVRIDPYSSIVLVSGEAGMQARVLASK